MYQILRYLTISLFILVVAVLLVILLLVFNMPDLPTTSRHDEICLPISQRKLTCGAPSYLLHDYISEATSKEYQRIQVEEEERQQKFLDGNRARLTEIYDEYFWELKPAAKVTGKDQPDIRESDKWRDMTPIREWRHGRELYDGSGFKRYGVQYINGRLVVPVSGTYFIYSFVDFFEPFDPSTREPPVSNTKKPVGLGIYKFNILEEEEIELVSDIKPHKLSDNKYFNSHSSYVSVLANLKAGDEISVKVSDLRYLKYTRNNYFGLNLI